jgi:hypothetical protein
MPRRFALLAASIALAFSARVFADAPVIKAGDELAICGDSITEQRIYSVFMEDYLLMCKPAEKVRSIQFVHEAVQAQQGFETPFIKSFVVNIPTVAALYDDPEKATLEQLVSVGEKKDHRLFDTAASLVTPVHHTIKISPAAK